MLAGGAAALAVLPDRLGVGHRFPFVAAVAWRPQAALGALVAAGLLAVARPTRGAAAAALGAVGLAGVGAVAGRAVAAPVAPAGPSDVTVLTSNVLLGRADTGGLAAHIERERPDLVVLPEAGHDFRAALMPLVADLGYRSWVSTGPGAPDVSSVTLLAAGRVGDVTVRPGTGLRLPHLEATGGILGDRCLFAVHTAAPVTRPLTRCWRDELALIGAWTRARPAPIIAGDLNATFDHSALRAARGNCRSAAAGTGRGLVGTYPASLPRWFGIQIDHVLVPADAVTTRFEILDVAGSDHRAVLAGVRLPPTP